MGPFPSIGFPRESTTLPRMPSPTFIDAILLVLLTVSPSLTPFEGPNNTIPTWSSSKLSTIPWRPLSKDTSSPYSAFVRP